MMKHTNVKQIGCLLCLAVLLAVCAVGCTKQPQPFERKEQATQFSRGFRIEVDGVSYWTHLQAKLVYEPTRIDSTALLVYPTSEPLLLNWFYTSPSFPITLTINDESPVVIKANTLYFIQEGKVAFEKKYQELGIDASRLNVEWNDEYKDFYHEYLRPILEPLIREHLKPQEPEMEAEQNDHNE